MTRDEFIASLREAADFLEASPGVPVPGYPIEISTWQFPDFLVDDPDAADEELKIRMAGIARAMGGCEKKYESSYFSLTKKIGAGVLVRALTNRDSVCEARVVGTRVEPGRIIPARTVPVVEWDCSPLLSD
jgi:hypothetical protein